MAFTIGEANGLNTVFRYVAGEDRMGVGLPTRESAEEALALLLKGSDKTLMAGYKPDDAGRLLNLVEDREYGTSDAEISAKVDIFSQDNQWWVLITGEMFGPFRDQDEALDALPEILRSLP